MAHCKLLKTYLSLSFFSWPSTLSRVCGCVCVRVQVLRAVVAAHGSGDDFFSFAAQQLGERAGQLRRLFAGQNRFSLRSTDGNLFIWVQCMWPKDGGDCAAPFISQGISVETVLCFSVCFSELPASPHCFSFILYARVSAMGPIPVLSAFAWAITTALFNCC